MTVEIVDWPNTAAFPAVPALPTTLTEDEWGGLRWPAHGAFENIADRVLGSIDWTIPRHPPPWEIRGISVDAAATDAHDRIAQFPDETPMPGGG